MQENSAVGAWEQSVALIPDSVYLDIVRNFLGKVPTPFHKPHLTKQLTALFTGKEFQNQLVSRLSDSDVRILTAIHLIGSPTQDEICNLFTGLLPFSTVLQLLVNLEERLLVVPRAVSSAGRSEIMINPLLEKRLIDESFTLTSIFCGDSEKRFRFTGGDKNILRALLSLHMHENLGNQERSEKLLESRYLESIFGASERYPRQRIINYNRMLYLEHVVEERGRSSKIQRKAVQKFLSLEPDVIQLILCVDSWLTRFGFSHAPHRVTRPLLQAFFSALFVLLDSIPITNEAELLTALKIVAYRNQIPVPADDEVLTLLYSSGLSACDHDDQRVDESQKRRFKPTIDSDLTISFGGDLEPVAGQDFLFFLAKVKKIDVVSSYEIDKSTILRAFDIGLTVPEIISYLETLTGSSFPSLKSLISQWKEEFTSITIYDGIVIKADVRQSRIIEALPQLQPHVITTISPGIYLFSRSTESTWRELLASAGNGILPSSIGEHIRPRYLVEKDVVSGSGDELSTLRAFHESILQLSSDERKERASIESLENVLKKEIQTKARSNLEREEMLSRLERKLILIPSQVTAIQGPSQTLQASGFDHQGKINLCRSAVQSPVDLLELHVIDEEGESSIILAEAKELIYPAKDAALRVHVLPNGEERVLPIARIFKIRKFKRSIFF